ncbi:ribosomal protein S5 domain 2-like protein [Delitschia confertaspora ATCC 74209]|uniref:Ribosomal RNA-processing protein 43 n=1 Tax=Delitschia confertaspora ATCC 74209 TaxID=1513339 RepID=A0A9P4MMV6_9PLEO|nr:ribosomal protein S5 domain 2-like protein [Delitschia confertaspora ATCC 74209]
MATTQSAPTLTFPRPIFAALSPSPFLQAHLAPKNPIRANARAPTEFRKPGLNTGSLTHCNGSAVVRLGNTTVVCGVRAEVLRAEDVPQPIDPKADEEDDVEEIDTLRLLVPNVELSTGSTPTFLPGQAPSTFAQSLITRIRSLLLSTRLVRAKDLRIMYTPPRTTEDEDEEVQPEVKAYWTLYIDTMFISLDGDAFDAAWGAILAALRNTMLPASDWDQDLEMVLCDDDVKKARKLELRGLPVAATFAVFQGEEDEEGEDRSWVLSDPDAFEEGVCRESVTIVVDGKKGSGKIRRIEKSGGTVVGREVMKGLIRRSEERWEEWNAVLKG